MKLFATAFLALALTAPAIAQTGMAQKAMTPAAVAPHITSGTKLLEDFGGKPGLVTIMDDFMVNLLADPRTKPFFENVDQTRVKAMLVDQFCEILNGGCVYSGRSMVEAHQGMGVKESHFLALVEALQKSMDKYKVPFSSQNKLLAALAPQHRDIIANQ
jgi:hemoglobin